MLETKEEHWVCDICEKPTIFMVSRIGYWAFYCQNCNRDVCGKHIEKTNVDSQKES